jgi:hypothetical protein
MRARPEIGWQWRRVARAVPERVGARELRRQAEVSQDPLDQRRPVNQRDEPQPPTRLPGSRRISSRASVRENV